MVTMGMVTMGMVAKATVTKGMVAGRTVTRGQMYGMVPCAVCYAVHTMPAHSSAARRWCLGKRSFSQACPKFNNVGNVVSLPHV